MKRLLAETGTGQQVAVLHGSYLMMMMMMMMMMMIIKQSVMTQIHTLYSNLGKKFPLLFVT
jgi:hypothetical protein